MSATYTFAASTANYAGAASQSKYGNATALAFKMRVKGSAFTAIGLYVRCYWLNFPDRGIKFGLYNDPDTGTGGNWNYAVPGVADGNVGFSPRSLIDASTWYVVYMDWIPGVSSRFNVFESDGTPVFAVNVDSGAGALPSAGSGNGTIRLGNDGTTSHAFEMDGIAIYSAALVGGAQWSAPTVADANLLGMYTFDEGTGTTVADATGGTDLTLAGSGTWNASAGTWDGIAPETLTVTTEPTDTASGSPTSSVVVESGDSASTETITATLVGGGFLSGTTTAVMTAGVATFTNLIPNGAGLNRHYHFTAPGHAAVDSDDFDVTGGGTLIFSEDSVSRLIKDGETTAGRKRIPLRLRGLTGAPTTESMTGRKAQLAANGGSETASTNDIVMVSGTIRGYVELHNTEAAAFTPGDIVEARVAADDDLLEYVGTAEIVAGDAYAAPETKEAIAAEVVAQEKAAIGTIVRTGNTTLEIDGDEFDITTDADFEPIESITPA